MQGLLKDTGSNVGDGLAAMNARAPSVSKFAQALTNSNFTNAAQVAALLNKVCEAMTNPLGIVSLAFPILVARCCISCIVNVNAM